MNIELKKENHANEPRYVYRLYIDTVWQNTWIDTPVGKLQAETEFERIQKEFENFKPLEQSEIIKSITI